MLNNLHFIKDEIGRNLGTNLELSGSNNIPDTFFERDDTGVRTTDKFKNWFDSILNLCPPVQPQLTSLLLLYSKVKADLAKEFLGDEITQNLGEIGMIDNFNNISNIQLINKISWLTEIEGVFDLRIKPPEELQDINLPALQILFFKAFSTSMKEVDSKTQQKVKSWFEKALSKGGMSLGEEDEREFGSIAHFSPLYLEGRNRPTVLFTGGRYAESNKERRGLYRERSRVSAIRTLLKRLGILEGSE